MSDYSQTTDFSAKDALTTGDPNKLIKGSEFDTEFAAISTAITSKYDSNDIASVAQAEAESSNATLITPSRLGSWSDANGGLVGDIQALTDPGADRLLFWDDSAGAAAFLTVSTGLAVSTTNLSLSHLGIESLSDPGADRILFWDDSAGATAWLSMASTSGLAVSGTALALDFTSATEITMPNFSQSADKFVVSDAGALKVLPYDEAGIKVATVTGTSDTLAAGDMNTFIEYTNASAVTVTLNTGVGTVGNVVIIKQTGAGQVTIGGTATVESSVGLKTRTQDSVISLVCIAADTWALFGDQAS